MAERLAPSAVSDAARAEARMTHVQRILRELADATKAFEAATGEARREQQRRDGAIVDVSKLGVPRSTVARVARLTAGRVQQLLEAAGAAGVTGDEWKETDVRNQVEAAIEYGSRPSVGVGVRRESKSGPHVGRGVGGAVPLTGDIDRDRAGMVETLEGLVRMASEGRLDYLLRVDES